MKQKLTSFLIIAILSVTRPPSVCCAGLGGITGGGGLSAAGIYTISGSITTFATTGNPSQDSEYTVGGGLWQQLEANLVLGTSPYFAITNLIMYGDSITLGDTASSPQNSYAYLLSHAQSLNEINLATSGTQISDEMRNIYSSPTYGANIRSILTGYNDMRSRGTNATLLNHFAGCLLTALAWGSLPPESPVWPPTAAPAGWAQTGAYGITNYISSNTAGSQYNLNLSGSELFLELVRVTKGGGTLAVAVDGVLQTNVFLGGGEADYQGQTNSSTLIIVSGLSNTLHTLNATCLGGGLVTAGWAAGWDAQTPGQLFYCGNCLRMPESSYIQNNDPGISLGSDAAVADINLLIQQDCETLAALGLPVWYVDVSSHFFTATMTGPDGIHPNNLGHQAIAACFLNYVQGRGASSLSARPGALTVYSQAGRLLELQSSADLKDWSPFTQPLLSTGELALPITATNTTFFRAVQ